MAIDRKFIEQRPELEKLHTLLTDPTVPKVFDFDDTIATTSLLQRTAVETACRAMGMEVSITPEYGAMHLRGKSGREIMITVLEKIGREAKDKLVDELIILRDEALVTQIEEAEDVSIFLKPGVDDIIRLLRSTNQRAAIATQSPEMFVRAFISRLEVDCEPVADVLQPRLVTGANVIGKAERRYSSDNKILTLGKPNAISVIHGAKKISPEYQHILYIGDNAVDARTVAGVENITGVIVNNDPAKREQLRREFGNAKNIIVVGSLAELVYG